MSEPSSDSYYEQNAQENIHQDIENKKKMSWVQLWSYSKKIFVKYFPLLLFIIGLPAAGMQGFFAIDIFINSVAAIPGMAFLHLIPAPFIIISAGLLLIYSVTAEQQVFKEPFLKLIRQVFRLSNEKDNDELSRDKLNDINTLNQKIDALTEKLESNEKLKHRYIIKSHSKKSIIEKVFSLLHLAFGYTLSAIVITLRALVSIGSSMLGMQALSLLILTPLLGMTTFPVMLLPAIALISAISYFIKNSQMTIDQKNKTLKSVGLERFVYTDLKKFNEEHYKKLKLLTKVKLSNQDKQKEVLEKKINKLNRTPTKDGKSSRNWLDILVMISSGLFFFGVAGSSMQGFFSIKKFVSQMSKIPILDFLKYTPKTLIYGACALISAYIAKVEQMLLKPHYDNLVKTFLLKIKGLFVSPDKIEKNKVGKAIKLNATYNNQKITRKLKESDYYIKNNKIYFYNKKSYVIFKLSYKIEQLLISKELSNNENLKQQYDKLLNHLLTEKVKPQSGLINLVINKLSIITDNKYYKVFAEYGSYFVLLIRAVTSIGPSILGLTAAAGIVATAMGMTLGPWFIAVAASMATIGYIIKCSQNIRKHYQRTLENMFLVKQSPSYEKLQDNAITDLERLHTTAMCHYLDNNCKTTDTNYSSPKKINVNYYNSQTSLQFNHSFDDFPLSSSLPSPPVIPSL